jgi:hypothetical protein
MYYIPKHTRELKKIKAEVHKAEAWDIKKKGSNQSDRSKLKRKVGMERCLPIGRVGED